MSSDVRDEFEDLTDEQSRTLANVYQVVTSKLYTDQSPREVLDEIMQLKFSLRVEANHYNLRGTIGQIHTALVIEDLDNFTVDEMIGYMKFMHYQYNEEFISGKSHMEVAWYLLNLLWERLEIFRDHAFINQIFFASPDNVKFNFDGIFYRLPIPKGLEIQKRGIDFYYPRVGELTLNVIADSFDFREVLHMVMAFGVIRAGKYKERATHDEDTRIRITNMTTVQSVQSALIIIMNDLELDPRYYMTLEGPMEALIQEPFETMLSINEDAPLEYLTLIEACSREGLVVTEDDALSEYKPIDVLFHDYTVAQLTPAFCSHPGEHRSALSATNSDMISGQKLMELDVDRDVIFFGLRDGFSKMTAYTLQQLHETFTALQDFYDPITVKRYPQNPLLWSKFPTRTVRRLLEVVLHSKLRFSPHANVLVKVCQKLLNQADDANNLSRQDIQKRLLNELVQSTDKTHDRIRKALIVMYNMGLFFTNFYDEVEYYDNLLYRMLDDPVQNPPPAHFTGRVRAKCRDMIARIQLEIENIGENSSIFNRLTIVKFWNNKPYFAWDDETYSIENFLIVMLEMSKFHLVKSLVMSGKWLMVTATTYFRELFGVGIVDTFFHFEEK